VQDKRIALIIAVAALAAIVGAIMIFRSSSGANSPPTRSASGCRRVEKPQPRTISLKAPPQTVKKGEGLTAVMKTSCGTLDIALDTTRAPITTNSFAYLARRGFYEGLTFHRISAGFVIQGGDPNGTGTGGPGYSVDEKPPPNLAYTRGVVAMAKTSAEPPGRSGSQFFVVIGADAGLPPDYALLGRVSKGFNVVNRIGKLGTATEQPKQTVLIDKVTIEKG
jgi:peptidyl-prolyl cis-trans isomerase B (cyclophilin B)